jgi:hypothetical protein
MLRSDATVRPAATAAATLALVLTTAAWALDPVNRTRGGVAIEGYDAVAYFLEGKPVRGSEAWVHGWNGATWRFSSAENRERFAAEPERYAPQYGGYCAYAVSENTVAGIDPEAWAIIGGRLYLNYSREVQDRWRKDLAVRIPHADANWPRLLAEGK